MTFSGKLPSPKLNSYDMALISLFTALLAVCSWISIPAAVPFTLQTFAVFLAVGVLGGRRGTCVAAVYLLLGAVGAPVFAGFAGGIGYLFGNTGGYVVGFLFSALSMWGMEAVCRLLAPSNPVLLLSMVIGQLICYAFGTLWFVLAYTNSTGAVGFGTALSWCVLPYLLPDAVKIWLACALSRRLRGRIPN